MTFDIVYDPDLATQSTLAAALLAGSQGTLFLGAAGVGRFSAGMGGPGRIVQAEGAARDALDSKS